MPQYVWRELSTGREVEVVRSLSEYDIPPTVEESGVEYGNNPGWERVLQPTNFQRGGSWRGSKGNW